VPVTKNVQQARINGLGFETREGGGNLHASGVWKRKKDFHKGCRLFQVGQICGFKWCL